MNEPLAIKLRPTKLEEVILIFKKLYNKICNCLTKLLISFYYKKRGIYENKRI